MNHEGKADKEALIYERLFQKRGLNVVSQLPHPNGWGLLREEQRKS